MKHPYAQKLLHQALLLLLQKKPLDKISVSELCKKAGVNRTTFYNHYTAPSDILYELVQQFAAEFPLSDISTAPDILTRILTAMENNLNLSRTLSQAFPGTFLSDTILALPQIDALLSKKLSSFERPRDKAAVQAFISAGSSRLISDWLLCDDRCSPQEEAELILSLCSKLYS